jgi:hypothetical protein
LWYSTMRAGKMPQTRSRSTQREIFRTPKHYKINSDPRSKYAGQRPNSIKEAQRKNLMNSEENQGLLNRY